MRSYLHFLCNFLRYYRIRIILKHIWLIDETLTNSSYLTVNGLNSHIALIFLYSLGTSAIRSQIWEKFRWLVFFVAFSRSLQLQWIQISLFESWAVLAQVWWIRKSSQKVFGLTKIGIISSHKTYTLLDILFLHLAHWGVPLGIMAKVLNSGHEVSWYTIYLTLKNQYRFEKKERKEGQFLLDWVANFLT